MRAQDILNEAKAEQELRKLGWEKRQCRECDGYGEVQRAHLLGFWTKCHHCNGEGFNWIGPIAK